MRGKYVQPMRKDDQPVRILLHATHIWYTVCCDGSDGVVGHVVASAHRVLCVKRGVAAVDVGGDAARRE
eukprot:SAG11_NODE_919_length_6545_cov_5.571052_4_plen_69_part_00